MPSPSAAACAMSSSSLSDADRVRAAALKTTMRDYCSALADAALWAAFSFSMLAVMPSIASMEIL